MSVRFSSLYCCDNALSLVIYSYNSIGRVCVYAWFALLTSACYSPLGDPFSLLVLLRILLFIFIWKRYRLINSLFYCWTWYHWPQWHVIRSSNRYGYHTGCISCMVSCSSDVVYRPLLLVWRHAFSQCIRCEFICRCMLLAYNAIVDVVTDPSSVHIKSRRKKKEVSWVDWCK